MLSWVTKAAQSTLASVAGTAEPIYGPEALHSVALQEDQNPKYEITDDDLKWRVLETTCAEMQTFYTHTDSGHFVMLQVIYSNVANLHISAQFNVKVFYPDGKPARWSAKTMTNYAFDETFRSFVADDFSIVLNEAGDAYHIKSQLDPDVQVDVTIKRQYSGFKVGKDAMTNYGDDPLNPWGCIRHIFWPMNKASGTVTIKEENIIDVAGKNIFVMALQGMKPHHAAATWNFITVQSENVSAIMMEFTTPPSYGSQMVSVGTVWKDGKMLLGTTSGIVQHPTSKLDPVTEWQEPTSFKVEWKGKDAEGKECETTMETDLDRIDCMDIMAEVPAIIKKFVANAVGTRPYMYQYRQEVTLKIKVDDQVTEEKGMMFAEATFIS